MADLKSATPKTPETGMKLYATDKKLNFVPQCNLSVILVLKLFLTVEMITLLELGS